MLFFLFFLEGEGYLQACLPAVYTVMLVFAFVKGFSLAIEYEKRNWPLASSFAYIFKARKTLYTSVICI